MGQKSIAQFFGITVDFFPAAWYNHTIPKRVQLINVNR